VKATSYEDMESMFNKLPKYQMKILLGGFSAKAGREDILNPLIGNENHKELVMIMELE
jgi:hypothetical protein